MSVMYFIHQGVGIAPVALEFTASATLSDLYGAMESEIGHINFRLSFGGRLLPPFDDDGKRPYEAMSNLGIGQEANIECETYEPQDWELLLRTLEPNLLDKYNVLWWQDAANCRKNLGSDESDDCSNQAICNNPNWSSWIQCDDTDHFTNIDASTETNLFRLNGVLSLHSLPPTVTSLNLRGQSIENVHLGELSERKELSSLNLGDNELTQIDFRGLGGTSLKELNLDGNHIFKVDFCPLKGTALLHTLALDRNRITKVNIGELVGSALTHLNVRNNPIQCINFKGIRRTQLTHLDWMTAQEAVPCGNCRFKFKQRIKNHAEIEKSKLVNKHELVDTISNRRFCYYFFPGSMLVTLVLALLCHEDLVAPMHACILVAVLWIMQLYLNRYCAY